ncbi:hypothetical protein [Actinoplanes xinjiangensis]|uniref:Uncharacterized protein n=1 Tax=Actinoplanes xinjiangensis TaxID=512350 RepID=A0A316EIP0_9ACTN|nr:hypothetical protein [Actinoplanes xinjiangensis]PWK29805.1 hypothetical protein BC793_14328 [Actinoplanes xinjiangensis]
MVLTDPTAAAPDVHGRPPAPGHCGSRSLPGTFSARPLRFAVAVGHVDDPGVRHE